MDRLINLRDTTDSFSLYYQQLLIFFSVFLSCFHSSSSQLSAWDKVQSPNFLVTAETKEFAQQVADTAEKYRRELAVEWLGKEMPQWAKPCIVTATSGKMGAGGETTFSFCNGEVYGWKMNVRGTRERILDSVVPHEVTHTILACHFRCPLPRWADEGASTLIEHNSEKARQMEILHESLAGRRIPLKQLFNIKDYPAQMRDVLTLYAEGYSVVDYLVDHGGKKYFIAFLQEGMNGNWDSALLKYYKITNVESLEATWQKWVMAGSPHQQSNPDQMLADNHVQPVIRGQNPETSVAKEPVILTAAEPIKTSSEVDWSQITLPDEPNRSLDLRARPSRDQLERPVYTLRPVQNSRYDAGPTHYTSQTKQGKDLFAE